MHRCAGGLWLQGYTERASLPCSAGKIFHCVHYLLATPRTTALTSYGFPPLLLQCRTPYAVIHGLVLLMMGMMMPETCSNRSLTINIRLVASCWFLSLHPTFTMHAQKILKLSIHLQYFGLLCRKFVK